MTWSSVVPLVAVSWDLVSVWCCAPGVLPGGTDMLAALLHMKFQQYSVYAYHAGHRCSDRAGGIITVWIEERTLCDHSHRDYDKSVGSNSRRIQNVQSSVYFVREERGDCTGYYDGTGPWYDRSACKRQYTRQEKCMLLCVVSRKEIVWLKEIVMKTDPKAFLIICDAREVWGEGFQSYSEKM